MFGRRKKCDNCSRCNRSLLGKIGGLAVKSVAGRSTHGLSTLTFFTMGLFRTVLTLVTLGLFRKKCKRCKHRKTFHTAA